MSPKVIFQQMATLHIISKTGSYRKYGEISLQTCCFRLETSSSKEVTLVVDVLWVFRIASFSCSNTASDSSKNCLCSPSWATYEKHE